MLIGIGNVTELSEMDSAGLNFLRAAICHELSIKSVFTTEVIHWRQSAVGEFERARRLVKFAVEQSTFPKHVNAGLVLLREKFSCNRESDHVDSTIIFASYHGCSPFRI